MFFSVKIFCMPSAKAPASNSVLRNLPSVDELLRSKTAEIIIAEAGERYTGTLARFVIDEIRQEIDSKNDKDHSKESLMATAENNLESAWASEQLTGTHRVI